MTYEQAIKEIETIKSLEEMCKIAGLPPNTTLGTSKDVIDACTLAIQALKECHYHHQIFEYCIDCKEYDREHHCCHRFTKVIGTTIYDARAEMTKDIIEQIDKLYREPFLLVPKDDYLDLFKKIITDWRDRKGPWAIERKDT